MEKDPPARRCRRHGGLVPVGGVILFLLVAYMVSTWTQDRGEGQRRVLPALAGNASPDQELQIIDSQRSQRSKRNCHDCGHESRKGAGNECLAHERERGRVGASPLAERDPGRLHITRRQMAFALALAVVAILATIFTVNSVKAGAQSFPAVVTTSKVYDLNFTNNGMVSAVLVKVGDRVKPGQILATQADSSLQTQLAADEATVKADREVLVQAGSPALTAAQFEQDNLQAQQAQTALNNANAALAVGGSFGKGQRGCGPIGRHIRTVTGTPRTAPRTRKHAPTDPSRPTPALREFSCRRPSRPSPTARTCN